MNLFQTELPENKSIFFGLVYIYGIGKNKSKNICNKLGFSVNCKIKYLSYTQKKKLENYLGFFEKNFSTSLKNLKLSKLENLTKIKSYRGLRLKQRLPVRGQRTHTNAKSIRKYKVV